MSVWLMVSILCWFVWCGAIHIAFKDDEDKKREKAFENHCEPLVLELTHMCVMMSIPPLFFFLGFMAGR